MPRKLRILLADDDETFALLVRKALSRDPEVSERFDLKIVTDGAEVVEYVLGNGQFRDRVTSPVPDVILMDQRMSRWDGAEALKKLKLSAMGSLFCSLK